MGERVRGREGEGESERELESEYVMEGEIIRAVRKRACILHIYLKRKMCNCTIWCSHPHFTCPLLSICPPQTTCWEHPESVWWSLYETNS